MNPIPNKPSNSIWSETVSFPHRKPLTDNLTAEAAVIGAGMAGILTAYLLHQQGIDVVVLEANRIASGQTKNTTAKITSQHGMIYHNLIKKVGADKARLYAHANQAAIDAIKTIVSKEQIECHFESLPSYLYSTDQTKKEALKDEAAAAASLGIPAYFTEVDDLPFDTAGAVCFENQAQFHPLEFLRPLANQLTIYEKTRVRKVKKHTIITDKGSVTARHIIFATHYPFLNLPGFFFARLHQDRSYCLLVSGSKRLSGMYYSVDKQGLSLRWFEDMLLLGGGSHRTGKNRSSQKYEELKTAARQYDPHCKIEAQWAAQDCMTHDNIPFIGSYSIFRPYWYVATGFKKWGMTSSMLSAIIIKDRICGLQNPYEVLFRPQRLHLRASLTPMLTDIWESTKGLTKGLFHLPLKSEHLTAGHGKIMRIGFRRFACYLDDSGKLHKISARCPHLGCQLEWNPTERSWDCPCHGSRFDYDGNLIDNPAQNDLSRH